MFALSGDRAGGPDGLTEHFYQTYWKFVGKYIYDMLLELFEGAP